MHRGTLAVLLVSQGQTSLPLDCQQLREGSLPVGATGPSPKIIAERQMPWTQGKPRNMASESTNDSGPRLLLVQASGDRPALTLEPPAHPQSIKDILACMPSSRAEL